MPEESEADERDERRALEAAHGVRVLMARRAIFVAVLVILATWLLMVPLSAALSWLTGGEEQAARELAASSWGPWLQFLPQLLLLLLAVAWLSRRSGQPTHKFLGLTPPAVSSTTAAVGVLGILIAGMPLALLFAALGLEDQATRQFSSILAEASPAGQVGYLLIMSLGPGLAEELFFRGYLQRRLLACWRPAVAIPVTALLFSIYHQNPVHAATVFPIGLWLGVLAWRSDSILPGIAAHTFNNFVIVCGSMLGLEGGEAATPAVQNLEILILASAACFPLALWRFVRGEPRR